MNIDARPSDALAIAVRAHVPILVDRSVMDAAGIIPEEDLKEEPDGSALPDEPSPVEDGEDRFSIFQDFLEGLDLDEAGDDESESKNH